MEIKSIDFTCGNEKGRSVCTNITKSIVEAFREFCQFKPARLIIRTWEGYDFIISKDKYGNLHFMTREEYVDILNKAGITDEKDHDTYLGKGPYTLNKSGIVKRVKELIKAWEEATKEK